MGEKQNIPEEEPIDNDQKQEEKNIKPESEIIDQKSDTENMEVHKHPHHVTHKKKWGEYFLEFLMIFLAVFLGFIAENIREHYVERSRAKEYAKSLYTDLKADTAFINIYSEYLILTTRQLDTLMNLINSGKYIAEAKTFYRLALDNRSVLFFQYNNSAFEQLKSSGNLRLLKDGQFADRLTEYDNMIHEVVKKQEIRYLDATAKHTACQWEILDADYYNLTNPTGGDAPRISIEDSASFRKEDYNKLKKFNNLYFEKRLILPPYLIMMRELKSKANNLVLFIRTKYHLE